MAEGDVAAGVLRMQPRDDEKEARRERAEARAEASRKAFSRKLSTSSSTSPAKFRIATGRGGTGSEAAFRTDESKLAGWVLLEKAPNVWRRRFVEVADGKLSVFKTGVPSNFAVASIDK